MAPSTTALGDFASEQLWKLVEATVNPIMTGDASAERLCRPLNTTYMTAKFLTLARGLSPHSDIDKWFVKMYTYLVDAPEAAQIGKEGLWAFATEYSMILRTVQMKAADEDFQQAVHVFSDARRVFAEAALEDLAKSTSATRAMKLAASSALVTAVATAESTSCRSVAALTNCMSCEVSGPHLGADILSRAVCSQPWSFLDGRAEVMESGVMDERLGGDRRELFDGRQYTTNVDEELGTYLDELGVLLHAVDCCCDCSCICHTVIVIGARTREGVR